MYCRNCGKQIKKQAYCPYCKTPTYLVSQEECNYKRLKKKTGCLCMFILLLALIAAAVAALTFFPVDTLLRFRDQGKEQVVDIQKKEMTQKSDLTEESVFVSEVSTDDEGIEMTTSFESLPLSFIRYTKMKVRLTNVSVGKIENFTGQWEGNRNVRVKGDNKITLEKFYPGETCEFTVDIIQRIPTFIYIIVGIIFVLFFLFLIVIRINRYRRRGKAMLSMFLAVVLTVGSVNLDAFAAGLNVDGMDYKTAYELPEKKAGKLIRNIESHQMNLQLILNTNFTYNNILAVRSSFEDGKVHLIWSPIEEADGYRLIRLEENGEGQTVEAFRKDEFEATFKPEIGKLTNYQLAAEIGARKILLSGVMNVIVSEDGKAFLDSDGDLLPDEYETAFGTSTSIADTDGDGLSDMDEITITMTDPLKNDTDGNGIPDGEEDSDADGLTNIEEIKYGTMPYESDTDGDGLLDGLEVNDFRSDPLKADTDDDGLSDAAEQKLGTDPKKKDTNNNGIGDADETYISEISSDSAGTILTLEASGSVIGNAAIINQTENVSFANLDYIASEVVDIQVEGEFSSAFITIPYDPTFAGREEDLAVCYYNPDLGSFEVLEGQTVNKTEGTITAYTTHFSTFVLLYVPNWHAQFEDPFAPDRSMLNPVDVEMVIDESSSMEDSSKTNPSDPDRWRVTAAKSFVDALIDNDRVGVIGFNGEASRKSALTEDLDAAKAAIDSIVGNAGSTALYEGLKEALNELEMVSDSDRLPFIIALTDGNDSSPGDDQYEDIVSRCISLGSPIYTIGLGSEVDTGCLSWLAQQTGGDYFYIRKAEDLPMAFNRIVNNAVYGEDTDCDGLADVVEQNGLRDGTGKIYLTDYTNYDSDNDGLSDGTEAGNVFMSDEENEFIQYYIMLSDPTKEDTDGDGLSDLQEYELGTKPWCRDTDGDGLVDNQEVLAGFNPLERNPDGDMYIDYDEYYDLAFKIDIYRAFLNAPDGTYDKIVFRLLDMALDRDPYDYDNTVTENLSALLMGLIIGDFGENLVKKYPQMEHYVDCLCYIVGNIAGNLIPFVEKICDVRDMFANFANGHYEIAMMNAIGAVPVFGKATAKLSDILSGWASRMDDVPKLAKLLTFSADCFQSASEFFITTQKGIEFYKYAIKDGLKRQTHKLALKVADLADNLFKVAGDTKAVFYADDLIENGSQAIKVVVNDDTTSKAAANAIRSEMGNQIGGKLTKTASGTAYEKVRVLDLQCETYKNGSKIESTLRANVEELLNFNGNNKITEAFDSRILRVAIPDTVISEEMSEALVRVQKEAAEKGVILQYSTYILEGSGDATTIVAKANKASKEVIENGSKRIGDLGIRDGKVDGKIPLEKYNEYLEESIHNEESSIMTLGRYYKDIEFQNGVKVPNPESYHVKAGDTTYFSMDQELWEKIKSEYALDDNDMYFLFNKPALDKAIWKKKIIRFTENPEITSGSALKKEWEYLKDCGYTDIEKYEDGFWYAIKK